MLDQGRVGHSRGYVLHYSAAQCCSEHLYAATDAQHGHLAVVGQACECQFKGIALIVDAVQCRHGILAHQYRVDVGSARKQQPVDAVNQTDERGVGLASWRNDHGGAASSLDRAEITGEQLELPFVKVACNANNRPVGRRRQSLGVELVNVNHHLHNVV